MPNFAYEALSRDGRPVDGLHAAATIQEAEAWLVAQGYHPVAIHVAEGGRGEHGPKKEQASLLQRLKGISLDERILFCRQTATMLGAGLQIIQALRIMGDQAINPLLSSMLEEVGERIEKGASLSDSFNQYPKFCSPLFFSIIKVGEETGTLDQSFLYLAELYENERETQDRIKSATRYPKIVIGAIVGAIFFLMSFVVPKFITIFENSPVPLPLPTRILVVASDFVSSSFWLILLGAVAWVMLYRMILRYEQNRLLRDRLALQIPIFGALAIKIYMSRFCRVFSLLLKCGVDVIRTLELSRAALENLVLSDMVEQVTQEVRDGVEMHQAMARQKLFPNMIVQMVAIGEQSGQVDEMMAKVADYFDQEANNAIKSLSAMIEPILLLVMGVIVGFMALAIYMPMWDMMNVMK